MLRNERPQTGTFLLLSKLVIVVLWIESNGAVAQYSFEARNVMTKGTVELGGALGYAQGTTVVGNGPPRTGALSL